MHFTKYHNYHWSSDSVASTTKLNWLMSHEPVNLGYFTTNNKLNGIVKHFNMVKVDNNNNFNDEPLAVKQIS